MELKYFRLSEFDSPDEPGSGRNMHEHTLLKLDQARHLFGAPMRITSGYRTPEHNRKVGGVESSAHTRGYAADISTAGMRERDVVRLIACLTKVGFDRIGRAKTFVHVDDDPEKPSPAYWDYG